MVLVDVRPFGSWLGPGGRSTFLRWDWRPWSLPAGACGRKEQPKAQPVEVLVTPVVQTRRAGRGGVDRHARRLGERRHPAEGRGLPAPAVLQGRAVRPAQRPSLRDRPPPVPGRPRAGAAARSPARRPSSPRRSRTSSGSRRSRPRRRSASRSSTTRSPPSATRGEAVAAAQAALEQAALNLAWTRVTSPIDGIVGHRARRRWATSSTRRRS